MTGVVIFILKSCRAFLFHTFFYKLDPVIAKLQTERLRTICSDLIAITAARLPI